MTTKAYSFIIMLLLACLPMHASTSAEQITVNGKTLCVQFYTPQIVRVTVSNNATTPAQHNSYSVILKPQSAARLALQRQVTSDSIKLQSSVLRLSISRSDGSIHFASVNGSTLLNAGACSFIPCTHSVDKGKFSITQQFHLNKGEAVYGLGQLRDTHLNQRGRNVEIWNHNTYISIPYFTGQRGWGLYWDNAGKSRFNDTADSTMMSSEVASCIDYYFFYADGTQDGAISCIRQLTGKATMLPEWALGYWQSRERYKTSDEVAEVLDRYRQLQIPLDGIVQDWQYWGCDSNWNAMRFMNPYYINKVSDPAWQKYMPADLRKLKSTGEPRIKSPAEMVQYVHNNHAHIMISIWANFGPWTPQYRELQRMGALYDFDTWPRNAGVKPYDAFNPKARDVYWQYLKTLFNMGFDAWWTDSSEPDQFEKPGDDQWLTHDGSWLSVKNAFPLVHNKGIYEHQRATGTNHRFMQMTRSGAFGLQHYGTFSWSGDIQASWAEMRHQVPSALNYTMCGIPFWNTDISGFFYWDYNNDPKNPALQELSTRWMQWGTFMPMMRSHCSSPMKRELYLMGKQGDWAYDAQKAAIELRYRLLPYIYSTMAQCWLNDGSMMRALVFDFKGDSTACTLNNEYMFGRNILVEPVTTPLYTWKDKQNNGHLIYPDIRNAAAPVSVYLPAGTTWTDFYTNRTEQGGQYVQRPCPITEMPVYIKAGTILPFGEAQQYIGQKRADTLEVRIYPGADGSFTLYEDDGNTYNYEKGQYALIPFSYSEQQHKLTIGQRQGSYKGMPRERVFNLVLVTDKCTPGYLPMKPTTTVHYNGSTVTVKF